MCREQHCSCRRPFWQNLLAGSKYAAAVQAVSKQCPYSKTTAQQEWKLPVQTCSSALHMWQQCGSGRIAKAALQHSIANWGILRNSRSLQLLADWYRCNSDPGTVYSAEELGHLLAYCVTAQCVGCAALRGALSGSNLDMNSKDSQAPADQDHQRPQSKS